MTDSQKEITFIVIVSAILIAAIFYFDKDPFVGSLIAANKKIFYVFGFVFVALLLITGTMYSRTLSDDYDAIPSNATVKIIGVNIVIWCIFWTGWSVFNVVALLPDPFYSKAWLFSFLLANLPGVSSFLFALSLRQDERELLPDIISGNTPEEAALFEKLLQLRYYVSAYGIVTVPVYLVAFVIYNLIK